MRRIADLLERDYSQPITLRKLAAAVDRNPGYLGEAFRLHIGKTMRSYLTDIRMRRAAELIAEDVKIEAVALAVGYLSKRNFYRHFWRHFGLTPTEYRKTVRR